MTEIILNTALYDLISQKLSLSTTNRFNMHVFYSLSRNVNTGKKLNDELPVQKQLSEAIDEVNKAAEKRQRLGLSDISLKNALAQEGWIPNRAVQKAVEYFAFDFENAAPPASSSSIIYGITGEGQDVIVTDRRGYGHIPRTIARKFRDRVRLNTVVTKTDYSSYNIIKVSTESGEIYTADYVLVTFSSGVLINNQVVQFNPTLPSWKTNALNLVPVGYYCKIFMKFPRKFWDNNNYILLPRKRIQGDYVLWQNFEKETLFSGKNILQATLTGNDCLWTETLSDWEVIKEVMVKLEKVYGPNIPYPTGEYDCQSLTIVDCLWIDREVIKDIMKPKKVCRPNVPYPTIEL